MKPIKKGKGHGGAREGAGRKSSKKETFRLWLSTEDLDSVGRIEARAILEAHFDKIAKKKRIL